MKLSIRKCVSLTLLLSLLTSAAWAQKTVTGMVTDGDNFPLTGVNVLVVGSSTGTVTGLDGDYSLTVPEGSVLRFSYIGFTAQEVPVEGQTVIDVTLGADANVIDEVVVVGYGSQRREAVTGAVSSIDAEEVSALTVSNLGEAIQGRLAGVQVVSGGSPGAPPIIQVRGIGSISFGSGPLYVVDGVPGAGGLNQFDSRDIASINVLKDASATAVYGSRASNGVIIIETKKGANAQGLRMSLESTVGIQTQPRRYDLLNSEQYIQYAETFLGGSLPRDLDQPVYEGADQTFRETETDWQDAIFQDGLITQNSLHITGGGERSSFFSSFGYLKQEGIVKGSPYERFNFRINSEHSISEDGRFKFGQTLLLVNDERGIQPELGGRQLFLQAIQSLPYQPIYNPNNLGGFSGAASGLDIADPGNPVLAVNLLDNRDRVFKMLGTAYLTYEILDGLEAQAFIGGNYQNFRNYNHVPAYESTSPNPNNTVSESRNTTFSPLYRGLLNYDRLFGDHSINAVLVGEIQNSYYTPLALTVTQPNPVLDVLEGGADLRVLPGALAPNETTLRSFVTRVTYGYQGKYYATFSFRRDGSSIFAPGFQTENFPAGALGWNISEESFMEDTPFSLLKARVSYGRTGSIGLGPYAFQDPINGTVGPVFGGGNQPTISYINTLANPELRWELTDMLNIGLDMGFFNNRLNFSMEYYDRQVDNLILQIALPPSAGVATTSQNIGALQNNGFEFQGQYFGNPSGDFQWNVSANISTNANEVLSLANPDDIIEGNNDIEFTGSFNSTVTRVGDPVYSFFGFETDGIFQTDAEVQEAAFQNDLTAPGDIRFVDQNGDGEITAADRVIIGKYLPDFTYGFNFNGTYSNFDFNVFFQGSQGNDVYNGVGSLLSQTQRLFNVGTDILDAWTPQNTSTNVPRIARDDPNNNRRVSDRFVEDGSYLRMKALTVGYTLPLSEGGALSNLRLYLTGQNLVTLTGYSGLDPEIGGALSETGFDNGDYPNARSFIFGAQIGF
ncbi:TonB-linked SusC/RagA family outer membrane protein [Neolewinella xylanilytica]|uniref:TonB-linked SusC/RagA family outer membrane protein n=1 Tax=Neolewinella xylanilytica TaxID=1514080 RepID=A0A2S6I1N0_9BACT|nr:TonB-dependent receptor [Neolewinella xylanilytica]PPK85078.1 TonB-linked SusC/RagA family outer membrane protein [Neolewinella xylanilytica]